MTLYPDWSFLVSYASYDSAAESSVLLIIDTNASSKQARLELPGTVVDARFSAGEDILAAALGIGLRLWDTAGGEELIRTPVQASSIRFSPDSRPMVSSNFQGEVSLWGVIE